MTHNHLDNCTDCNAPDPYMYNCNRKGERIAGFICFDCWKAKHPVMRPDSVRMFHPITVRLIIALTIFNVAAIIFIIWEGLNK